MPVAGARYDGHAEWYDSWNMPHIERNGPEVAGLLGPGDGLCLDLGCGSGLYFGVLAGTGRTVVGLDRSADQLRIARGRSRQVVQARHTLTDDQPAGRGARPGPAGLAGSCPGPARDSTETGFRAIRAETGELRLSRGPFNQ